jgi:hypothetical protein
MIDYKVYRFPANRRADDLTLAEQLEYACGEVVEAIEALASGESPERVLEEIYDAEQTLEGARRKFRDQQVLDAYYKVVAKCQCRGDYDVQDLVSGDWGI